MWVNYDFVDQIIDMCTNQNPLYKIDNQISNWVNYDWGAASIPLHQKLTNWPFFVFFCTLLFTLSSRPSFFLLFHNNDKLNKLHLFASVFMGAFQITFRIKMYVNDVFSFLKNYFWHQHIKTVQNIQTILNFSKKKIQIFWEHSRNRVPKHNLTQAIKTQVIYAWTVCHYLSASSSLNDVSDVHSNPTRGQTSTKQIHHR